MPTGCSAGQVAKWNAASSSWVCANDQDTVLGQPQVALASVNVPADQYGVTYVSCPAGTRLTGGGFFASTSDLQVTENLPLFRPPTAWEVGGYNVGGSAVTLFAYAICLG